MPGGRMYPQSWREMSLDMKLCLASVGCMVGVWIAGDLLPIRIQLLIALMVAALAVSLSVRRRRQMDWRWPGTNVKGVLRAVGTAAAFALMFFACRPSFPFFERGCLGWYLAGVMIALFSILDSLHVVQPSEADFLKFCGPPKLSSGEGPQAAPSDDEPLWQRAARAIFGVLFVAVWIEFMASFYFFGVYFRNGAPKPTPTQTEQLINHGSAVYVTPVQKHLLDRLDTWSFTCIPAIMVAAAILHFIVGVKLFDNTPTLWEIRNRKNKPA